MTSGGEQAGREVDPASRAAREPTESLGRASFGSSVQRVDRSPLAHCVRGDAGDAATSSMFSAGVGRLERGVLAGTPIRRCTGGAWSRRRSRRRALDRDVGSELRGEHSDQGRLAGPVGAQEPTTDPDAN